MNAREAPLCGLAFNEGAVKSSKCYADVPGEEIGERGGVAAGKLVDQHEKGQTRGTKSNRQRE